MRKLLIAVSMLAVLLGLATPAQAAVSWTAKVGSVATGSGTLAGASSGTSVFKDLRSGSTITCTGTSISGQLPHLGSGLPATPIVIGVTSVWTGCTGIGMTFTLAQSGTWTWSQSAYNAATGTTTGVTGSMSLAFSAPSCSLGLTGSLHFSYVNSTGIFSFTTGSTLAEGGTTGCLGAFINGDAFSLQASYKITGTASGTTGPVTITSP